MGYWIRRDYLGFGIGAASLIDNVRFQNEKSLGAYLAHPPESREEEQTLTVQDRMEETMFLGLRLTRGVSCVDFAEQYGRTVEEVYGEVIARNVADGLLTVTERKENQEKRPAPGTDKERVGSEQLRDGAVFILRNVGD